MEITFYSSPPYVKDTGLSFSPLKQPQASYNSVARTKCKKPTSLSFWRFLLLIASVLFFCSNFNILKVLFYTGSLHCSRSTFYQTHFLLEQHFSKKSPSSCWHSRVGDSRPVISDTPINPSSAPPKYTRPCSQKRFQFWFARCLSQLGCTFFICRAVSCLVFTPVDGTWKVFFRELLSWFAPLLRIYVIPPRTF